MTPRCWQAWLWLLLCAVLLVPSSTESAVEVDGSGESCSQEDGTCTNEQQQQGPCVDKNSDCESWASSGECERNPKFMLESCQKSCMVCIINGTEEIDMGVKQVVRPGYHEKVQQRLDDAEYYLRNVVAKNPDPEQRKLLEICKNKKEKCGQWAVDGECEANAGFMKLNCAPVCQTCDQLSMAARCPVDLEKFPNAWKAGDLNEFFTNVTTLPEYVQYEPTILSRPDYLPGDTQETADYKVGPWIITLDNVVTEDEAERLIELGYIEGYEGSYAGGKVLPDGTYERGVSKVRTSYNTWCQDKCYNDEVAQRVAARIANITNIPEENSEYLQLLKYDVGQFYKTHSDYLEHCRNRQTGVRLLTVFLYLNDVEEGGGTEFPDYGITVQPKKGRALIWPSVLNEDPHEKDPRTEHQALPVLAGKKYAANAWIHMRDFKGPFAAGCN